MGVPPRNRILPVDDLGVLQRVFDSMPAAQIARFLQELPDTVVLAGGRRLEPALHASGRRVVLAQAVPAGIPDDAIIVWERAFDAEGYATVAELKRRFPGRVTTAFELLSKASFFQAVGELIGYHQAKGNEARLIDIMSGATPEPWDLGELDRLYPIAGKRVIEYGPLDGAMTATLLQLGAASVTGVEIRMTNVIKLLSAAHIFGWGDRFKLLIEDMHMVDASSAGRFDLAVAHPPVPLSPEPSDRFGHAFHRRIRCRSRAAQITAGGAGSRRRRLSCTTLCRQTRQ